jgi:cobalt/nickel transport system permease protein
MPDRVLDPAVWATLDVASAGIIGLAARKAQRQLEPKDVSSMAVLTAFIFAAQMVNFPVAMGVSGHVVGAALAAIIVGLWPAMLMMTTVLVLQALLYGDGGVAALGANVANMAIVAPTVALGVYSVLCRCAPSAGFRAVAAGVAAWISVVVSSACAGTELVLSGFSAELLFGPLVAVHALIGVGEAVVSAAAVSLVWRARPDLRPLGWQVDG